MATRRDYDPEPDRVRVRRRVSPWVWIIAAVVVLAILLLILVPLLGGDDDEEEVQEIGTPEARLVLAARPRAVMLGEGVGIKIAA